MLGNCLEHVRRTMPLIHNITNYVTVNDVANILLACGGSPIMADDPGEVEEITALCSGLNINIGTLNQRTVESMRLAGKRRRHWAARSCWTRWGRGLPPCGPARRWS